MQATCSSCVTCKNWPVSLSAALSSTESGAVFWVCFHAPFIRSFHLFSLSRLLTRLGISGASLITDLLPQKETIKPELLSLLLMSLVHCVFFPHSLWTSPSYLECCPANKQDVSIVDVPCDQVGFWRKVTSRSWPGALDPPSITPTDLFIS